MANSQRTAGKTEGNRKCPQDLWQFKKKKKKEEKENKPLPQREKRIMSRLPILFTPFHSLSLSCGRFVISILFSNDFPPLIAHLFLVFTVQFSPLQRSDRVINMSKHFARYP